MNVFKCGYQESKSSQVRYGMLLQNFVFTIVRLTSIKPTEQNLKNPVFKSKVIH